MTPESWIAIIGLGLTILALLGTATAMLFGVRERVSVLIARSEAREADLTRINDDIRGLRKTKHEHANALMKIEGRVDMLDEKIDGLTVKGHHR